MTDASLQRQRVAVSVLFILAGTVMGGWQGRIPSVRAQLGVGDGAWGLIVLGMPVGTLLALLVLQGVITRTGARLPARWGAAALLMIAPLAAASPSTLVMVATLLVMGVAVGLRGWLGADALWISFPVAMMATLTMASLLYLQGGWRRETDMNINPDPEGIAPETQTVTAEAAPIQPKA